ncbi:MAG: stage II sporulation protein M, partial [Bacillota bacterium]
IVGYSVEHLHPQSTPVESPACLLMVTDGVKEEALDERPADAAGVVERFSRPNDDATALIIHWG